MPGSYKTEAIVLKRVSFGEADRLVTVFSRNRGKLTLLAKGIRRLTSRKKGHLELFCQVDKLTAENQEHPDVYQLLLANLSRLDSQQASSDLIEKFETNLLSVLGFGLPSRPDRASLEAHILAITEKPLNSKKLK